LRFDHGNGRRSNFYNLKISRIPDLEYHLISAKGASICTEGRLDEKGNIDCKLITKEELGSLLQTKLNSCIRDCSFTPDVEDMLTCRARLLGDLRPIVRQHASVFGITEKRTKQMEVKKEIMTVLDIIDENVGRLSCAANLYIDSYLRLLSHIKGSYVEGLLTDHSTFIDLMLLIANLDIVGVQQEITTEHESKLLFSLDFSPQRLALALNDEVMRDKERKDRIFVPPMLVQRVGSECILFHAYRTLDRRPAYVPGMSYRTSFAETKKYHDLIEASHKIFARIKEARKGFVPRLLRSELAAILTAYVEAMPPARDLLLILDLGTGSGLLLAKVVDDFIREAKNKNLLHSYSMCRAILNDLYEEEKTGLEFVRYASSDLALGYVTHVYRLIQDLKDSIRLLGDLAKKREFDQKVDVCYINRVLDIYARYGFYRFETAEDLQGVSAKVAEKIDYDQNAVCLAYHDLIRFADLYALERSLLSGDAPDPRLKVLPGLRYDLEKDFLAGFDFDQLLELCSLVVISVFPGTSSSLFGDLMKTKNVHLLRVRETEATEKPEYSIFCITKDAALYEYTKKRLLTRETPIAILP